MAHTVEGAAKPTIHGQDNQFKLTAFQDKISPEIQKLKPTSLPTRPTPADTRLTVSRTKK